MSDIGPASGETKMNKTQCLFSIRLVYSND